MNWYQKREAFKRERDDRAAANGRSWLQQRQVDETMSGADELEASQPRTWSSKAVQAQNLPRVELSAHWWHG